MDAFTDYPIGYYDNDGKTRPCKIVAYDDNCYCLVIVDESVAVEIKAGYLKKIDGSGSYFHDDLVSLPKFTYIEVGYNV